MAGAPRRSSKDSSDRSHSAAATSTGERRIKSGHVAIAVSIFSLLSSAFYTYTYVAISQVSFFNEIHSEYASTEMQAAFDLLESFSDHVGAELYASEFVRLKALSRQFSVVPSARSSPAAGAQTIFWRQEPNAAATEQEEAKLGLLLDNSRRRILHYFGKLILFESLNYLQAAGLRKFPGAARAENAINLLEPLVEEGQRRCQEEQKCGGARASAVFEEHKSVMRGLRKLFRLPAKREAVMATTKDERRGTEATYSRVHERSL